jgi:hypothetical protein
MIIYVFFGQVLRVSKMESNGTVPAWKVRNFLNSKREWTSMLVTSLWLIQHENTTINIGFSLFTEVSVFPIDQTTNAVYFHESQESWLSCGTRCRQDEVPCIDICLLFRCVETSTKTQLFIHLYRLSLQFSQIADVIKTME